MHVQAIIMAAIPSGSFSPTDIAGLQLWLKADGNVYNTGTTQATNGQTVATWADASGNARDATQATGADKPTFQTNVVNSKPVIRFPFGGTSFMGTASGSYSVQSYFVVFAITNSGADSYMGIVTTRVSPNANKVGPSDSNLGYGTGISSQNTIVNVDSSAGGGNGATTYIAVDGVSLSTSAFDDFNSGGGVACSQTAFHYVTNVDTNQSPSGTKIFCIGADAFGASRYLVGDIAEIIIYDTNISGTNRSNVENYLKTKYGL